MYSDTVLLGQEYGSALPLAEEALAGHRSTLGNEHADTLVSINQLANIHLCLGELETALPLFEEDVRSSRRLLGAAHLTEPRLCSVCSFC